MGIDIKANFFKINLMVLANINDKMAKITKVNEKTIKCMVKEQ